MTEIYKDIIGYEGLYQVSNLGNVKSLPKGDGNGNRERLLRFEIMHRKHTNYHRVTLSKEGITKRHQVHRLVAIAFIPNPDNKPHVNHIDNDGTHNYTTNLEWCTASENMRHSGAQGRQDKPRSLGGVSSAKARELAHDIINLALIGQTFGNLTILSYYRDESLASNKAKFVCKCSCGNTIERLKFNMFNPDRLLMCNDCARKFRKMKI